MRQFAMSRATVKRLVRIGVSIALISLVVTYVDFGNTLGILAGVNPLYLGFAASLLICQTAISAAKWRLILSSEGERVRFLTLFRIYLSAQFVSLFLPSSIGGDVYRIAALRQVIGSFTQSTASIVFDRLSGLYALLAVGVAGSYWLLGAQVAGGLALALVISPFAAALLVQSGLIGLLERSRLTPLRVGADILRSQVRYARSHHIVLIMALALLFQSMIVVINFVYATALDLPVSFKELWAIVPVIYLTDMLPISINGIGVRDSAYVFFFTQLGYAAEQAFALAILILAMRYAVGMIGGALLLDAIWRDGSRVAVPIQDGTETPNRRSD